jgi:cyclopropane fatty-acyl-phospholipid synthase-like methyltransferase
MVAVENHRFQRFFELLNGALKSQGRFVMQDIASTRLFGFTIRSGKLLGYVLAQGRAIQTEII